MLRVCETFSVNRYIYNPVEYKGTVKVNGEVKDVSSIIILGVHIGNGERNKL